MAGYQQLSNTWTGSSRVHVPGCDNLYNSYNVEENNSYNTEPAQQTYRYDFAQNNYNSYNNGYNLYNSAHDNGYYYGYYNWHHSDTLTKKQYMGKHVDYKYTQSPAISPTTSPEDPFNYDLDYDTLHNYNRNVVALDSDSSDSDTPNSPDSGYGIRSPVHDYNSAYNTSGYGIRSPVHNYNSAYNTLSYNNVVNTPSFNPVTYSTPSYNIVNSTASYNSVDNTPSRGVVDNTATPVILRCTCGKHHQI